MFIADLIRSGTSLIVIFRVTLSRRKVRPLIMSPGLLDLADGSLVAVRCANRLWQ